MLVTLGVDFVAVVVVVMRPMFAECMRWRQATSEATKTVSQTIKRRNQRSTKATDNRVTPQANKQTVVNTKSDVFLVSSVVTFPPIQQQLHHHVDNYSFEYHHVAPAKLEFFVSNSGLQETFGMWAVPSVILLI